MSPLYDQQRGALALSRRARLRRIRRPLRRLRPLHRVGRRRCPRAGHGGIRSYLVPTAKQGGIWGSGGPVVGPDGTIYVSVGNGATTSALVRRQRLGHGADAAPRPRRHLRADGLAAAQRRRPGPRLELARAAERRPHPSGRQERHRLPAQRRAPRRRRRPARGWAASAGPSAARRCAGQRRVRALPRPAWPPWTRRAIGSACAGAARPASGDRRCSAAARYGWRARTRAACMSSRPAPARSAQQISLGGSLPHFVSPSLSGGLVLVGTLTGVIGGLGRLSASVDSAGSTCSSTSVASLASSRSTGNRPPGFGCALVSTSSVACRWRAYSASAGAGAGAVSVTNSPPSCSVSDRVIGQQLVLRCAGLRCAGLRCAELGRSHGRGQELAVHLRGQRR